MGAIVPSNDVQNGRDLIPCRVLIPPAAELPERGNLQSYYTPLGPEYQPTFTLREAYNG